MRMKWSGLGALLSLLVLAGCQREVPPEQRLTQAQQELEEVRRDAQAEMESLRRSAAERTAAIERELAEALALQEQRIAKAEQEWSREQRSFAENLQQRTGASVATLGDVGAVEGQIVAKEQGGLVVRDTQGRTYEMSTDARTRVTQNEQPVSLDMYTEGTQVRASFITGEGNERVAREVEILPSQPSP